MSIMSFVAYQKPEACLTSWLPFAFIHTSLQACCLPDCLLPSSGGPEVLKLETHPIPTPAHGQVLIRVKAFGLNRSELFTRQGHSPGVPFPRILGIEAVGLVAAAPGKEFAEGTKVATAMGGLGRQFDGGYAEYTCVPAKQVQARTIVLQFVMFAH